MSLSAFDEDNESHEYEDPIVYHNVSPFILERESSGMDLHCPDRRPGPRSHYIDLDELILGENRRNYCHLGDCVCDKAYCDSSSNGCRSCGRGSYIGGLCRICHYIQTGSAFSAFNSMVSVSCGGFPEGKSKLICLITNLGSNRDDLILEFIRKVKSSKILHIHIGSSNAYIQMSLFVKTDFHVISDYRKIYKQFTSIVSDVAGETNNPWSKS